MEKIKVFKGYSEIQESASEKKLLGIWCRFT